MDVYIDELNKMISANTLHDSLKDTILDIKGTMEAIERPSIDNHVEALKKIKELRGIIGNSDSNATFINIEELPVVEQKARKKPGRKSNSFDAKEYYRKYHEMRINDIFHCPVCHVDIKVLGKSQHMITKKHLRNSAQ